MKQTQETKSYMNWTVVVGPIGPPVEYTDAALKQLHAAEMRKCK